MDSEIPTPISGKIVEFLANENDTVEVGKVIARIETEGETESAQPQSEAPPVEKVEEPTPAIEPAKPETETAPEKVKEKPVVVQSYEPEPVELEGEEMETYQDLPAIVRTWSNWNIYPDYTSNSRGPDHITWSDNTAKT